MRRGNTTYIVREGNSAMLSIVVLHVPHTIECAVIWTRPFLRYLVDHLAFEVAKLCDICIWPGSVNYIIVPTSHYLCKGLATTFIVLAFSHVCVPPSIPDPCPVVGIKNFYRLLRNVDSVNWEVVVPDHREHNLHKRDLKVQKNSVLTAGSDKCKKITRKQKNCSRMHIKLLHNCMRNYCNNALGGQEYNPNNAYNTFQQCVPLSNSAYAHVKTIHIHV